MNLCRHFKCKEDQRDCLECYNGVCDGTSYDGHQRCGCDACEYHEYHEDEEVCTYGDEEEETSAPMIIESTAYFHPKSKKELYL